MCGEIECFNDGHCEFDKSESKAQFEIRASAGNSPEVIFRLMKRVTVFVQDRGPVQNVKKPIPVSVGTNLKKK